MKNVEVEKILRFYKEIDLDIKTTGEWLKECEQRYNTLSGVRYDGMPHGMKVADITASSAINLANTDARETMVMLEERMQELRRLKRELLKEITTLNPIHKVVLDEFYIKGHKWEQIAKQINYSVRQSKNIRHIALEALGEKMARNKVIMQSKVIRKILG